MTDFPIGTFAGDFFDFTFNFFTTNDRRPILWLSYSPAWVTLLYLRPIIMDNLERTCASLRAQIAATETQLAGLRRELESAEKAAIDTKKHDATDENKGHGEGPWPMLNEEYRRYGRQMIVPQLGIQGG